MIRCALGRRKRAILAKLHPFPLRRAAMSHSFLSSRVVRPVPLGLLLAAPLPARAQSVSVAAVRAFTVHAPPAREVGFSPDGALLAVSSADGTIDLRRVADGAVARTLRHAGGVTAVAFSPDGRWLAGASYDGTVTLWSVADGAPARTLRGHAGTVWTVAFSPDGERIASGGEDRTVRLWRVGDGAALRTLAGHSRNVWSVAFTPDGRRVVSGSFDDTVRVWSVADDVPPLVLTGHTQAVVGVAVSPDGRWIASSGDDSSIRLWRADDGRLVRTIDVGNHTYKVAFSPDGRWLAAGGRARGAIGTFWHQLVGNNLSASPGPSLRLFRVSDGTLQQAVAAHGDDVWSVAFSRDGRWLSTSSEDGTVKLWTVSVRD
jgi:WD40 repeat protein